MFCYVAVLKSSKTQNASLRKQCCDFSALSSLQVHVLTFTVYQLLSVLSLTLKSGDLDPCMSMLITVRMLCPHTLHLAGFSGAALRPSHLSPPPDLQRRAVRGCGRGEGGEGNRLQADGSPPQQEHGLLRGARPLLQQGEHHQAHPATQGGEQGGLEAVVRLQMQRVFPIPGGQWSQEERFTSVCTRPI